LKTKYSAPNNNSNSLSNGEGPETLIIR